MGLARIALRVETDKASLKRVLLDAFGGLSQMHLSTRVLAGECSVNGAVERQWGKKLRLGDMVEIVIDVDAATARRAEAIPLTIIHEDDDVVAIDKAAGMLVHPTKHVKQGTVANAMTHHLGGARFWFPHRLDRETSGVLLVCKTATALREVEQAWRSGAVEKVYVARVAGTPRSQRMDAPIGRHGDEKPEWAVRADGKPAVSELTVIADSLVELRPITGRTNQLRVHCAWLGHPIVGDTLYGGPPADRLYLHAEKLRVARWDLLAQKREAWRD
jgi:23S rRNA pseudouridine1911/1915/1917 synthase